MEPDVADPKEFGMAIKSGPALILFVPKNHKGSNEDLQRLVSEHAWLWYNTQNLNELREKCWFYFSASRLWKQLTTEVRERYKEKENWVPGLSKVHSVI